MAGDNAILTTKKKMMKKKGNRFGQKVDERGSVVDDEVGNVHNPVAGYRVFAGVFAE